jgi:hypothetical protein
VAEELVAVFHLHGGEGEQGEELPSVHGGIKCTKDDAMGSKGPQPHPIQSVVVGGHHCPSQHAIMS